MQVQEVFNWCKEFYPSFDMGYAISLCHKFMLNPKRRLKSLSLGYYSIFKVISALATDSEITLYDEPILGMDASHRDLFYKELLANYIEIPKTIIISTHIISEISNLIEMVIILKNYKLYINSNVDNLLKSACYLVPNKDILLNKDCIDISSTVLTKHYNI